MDLTRKVNEAMLDAGPKFRLVFIMPWLRRFKFYNTFQDNKARFQVRYQVWLINQATKPGSKL